MIAPSADPTRATAIATGVVAVGHCNGQDARAAGFDCARYDRRGSMSRFSDDAGPADARATARRSRLRFELFFASAWLGFGLFLLPAMIFAVGVLLLGPYGEGAGLGRFYLDFYADLGRPSGRTWAIALGPLLLVTFVRLVFVGTSKPADDDIAQQDPPSRARNRSAAAAQRVEPRIGLD